MTQIMIFLSRDDLSEYLHVFNIKTIHAFKK